MKILKQGIIYRKTDSPLRYQAWPTVCRDENGTLYTVCSGMRSSHVCPFGRTLMFTSWDNGDTWSCPAVINDTWLDDRDAGICYMGGGRLTVSYFCHPKDTYLRWQSWMEKDSDPLAKDMVLAKLFTYPSYTREMDAYGSYVRLSRNHGSTWEAAVKVPVSSPHGPVSAGEGRLLWLGKEMYSELPAEQKELIHLFESCDEGKSWQLLSTVPLPEGIEKNKLHEPHLAILPSGELFGAIRIEGNYPVEGGTVFTCRSSDGGKSWSVPKPTGLSGLPPHLTVLSDGRLLLTYGRRVQPFGIRAVISTDGGESFGEELLVADVSELAYAGDLGYPATVELEDGSLYTVYYAIVPGDDKPSILYSKWKI